MTPSTVHGVPYTIPPEPNRTQAILIALLVHAGLLGFLWIGIRWQNVEPVSVEAEVWDMKTQSAAPPAPRAEPVRQPEPAPQPKVEPPPPKVEEPPAPKPPDIALEREKEKKKLLLEKKLAEEKSAKEKARQLAVQEAKEQELADKKARELADKKKALDKAKLDKLAKAARDLADDKLAQKMRDLEMKRITSGVGTNGGAERATAPRIDTSYQAAISSKIKGATNYGGDKDTPGNPQVEFRIRQLPTGEIMSVKKIKSSGIAAFDDAVERGINNSSPLPKKKDGTVVPSLDISFKLKEFSDAQ